MRVEHISRTGPRVLTQRNEISDLPDEREQMATGRARAGVVGVFWSGINTLGALFATTIVFLVTSRILSPEDFGAVALATSIVTLVGCLGPVAFGEAIIQRRDLRDEHLDTLFWICMGIAIALYFALILASQPLADWIGEPLLVALLPVVGLRLLFDLAIPVPEALVKRRMAFRYIALRTVVANGIGGTVCLVLVFTGQGFWALAISQVVTAFVSVVILFLAARWWPGRLVTRQGIRDLWGYGVYAAGDRTLNQMNLDQIIIGTLAGSGLLGLYFFGKRLIDLFTNATAGAFHPVSHALLSTMQVEVEKRRETFELATFAATLVSFPVFAGIIATSDPGIPLVFGDHWREAIPVVQALSFIGLLASIGYIQGALITSQGRTDWWFWYRLLGQVASLAMIVALIGEGLAAAVWGVAIVRLLIWPISAWLTLKLLDISLVGYLRLFSVPAFAALLMAAGVIAIPSLLSTPHPISVLATQVVVGIFVYVPLAAALSLPRIRRINVMLRNRKTYST